MGNCICLDCFLKYKTNHLPLYIIKGLYRAKVVDVYDGDTVTIVIFNKFGFEKHKLRLYGIDTPEMKPSKNLPNREEHIRKAHLAKDKLIERINNKIVQVDINGYDKYGRLLGTIYIKSCYSKENINQYMLNNNYGYAYDGGTKNNI